MKTILTLFILAGFISCQTSNNNPANVIEIEKDALDTVVKLQEQSTKEIERLAAENKELKKKTERRKMLDNVVVDAAAFELGGTDILSTTYVKDLSATIHNNSGFTLTGVEVTFNYESHKGQSVLSQYVAKVGSMEPGTNKLVQAPKGDGYQASAYISKYTVRAIDMCYDENNITHKSDDPYTCLK